MDKIEEAKGLQLEHGNCSSLQFAPVLVIINFYVSFFCSNLMENSKLK